jgi:hypothetical protein
MFCVRNCDIGTNSGGTAVVAGAGVGELAAGAVGDATAAGVGEAALTPSSPLQAARSGRTMSAQANKARGREGMGPL